jgi:hypothetical protein
MQGGEGSDTLRGMLPKAWMTGLETDAIATATAANSQHLTPSRALGTSGQRVGCSLMLDSAPPLRSAAECQLSGQRSHLGVICTPQLPRLFSCPKTAARFSQYRVRLSAGILRGSFPLDLRPAKDPTPHLHEWSGGQCPVSLPTSATASSRTTCVEPAQGASSAIARAWKPYLRVAQISFMFLPAHMSPPYSLSLSLEHKVACSTYRPLPT